MFNYHLCHRVNVLVVDRLIVGLHVNSPNSQDRENKYIAAETLNHYSNASKSVCIRGFIY